MDPSFRHRQIAGRQSRGGCLWYAVVAIVLFVALRWLCTYTIDYQWWKEMGQLETWLAMLAYEVIPVAAVTLIAFVVFWIAHARGMMHGGTRMREHPIYAKLATAAAKIRAPYFIAPALRVYFQARQGVSGTGDSGGLPAAQARMLSATS